MNDYEIERILPPHNIEAEQIVLGSMITDNSTIPEVCKFLTCVDFYVHQHRHIFSMIQVIHIAKKSITVDSLDIHVSDREYLLDLEKFATTIEYLPRYINNVHFYSMTRGEVLRTGVLPYRLSFFEKKWNTLKCMFKKSDI